MNGGGSGTVAYPILEFFTDGKLGEFVSRTGARPLTIDANPIHNSQTVPLVVMVSEDTVSFGEIFAGVLRDARGARSRRDQPGQRPIIARIRLR
ncbi:MAG: S41 family peptidase [Ignavibacteriales bacterium]|nr:S41 family peptidase [Ignavibacteriales bacterium]